MMVTGSMPFADSASIKDPVYSQLCKGQTALFWDHYRVSVTSQEARQDSIGELKKLVIALMSGVIILIGKLQKFLRWFLLLNDLNEELKQKSYSPDFCHLMQKMLAYKPEDRLSLA